MGNHAKPRTRVRSVALGALAVGATLTGAGLTAAALDPAGMGLADGTATADPVNLDASGLGAPVPVANVSTLDGGTLAKGVLSAPGALGTSNQAAVSKGAGAGNVLGRATHGTVTGTAAGTATGTKDITGTTTVPGTTATSTATTTASATPTATAPKHAKASPNASSNASSNPVSTLATIASSDAPALPSVNNLPGVSQLTSAADQGKSLLTELLGKVAALV